MVIFDCSQTITSEIYKELIKHLEELLFKGLGTHGSVSAISAKGRARGRGGEGGLYGFMYVFVH